MSLKVKISNEFLDGGTEIQHDFSVNNLGDITTRQGGFSNTFTVPASSKNNRLLGYSNDVNSTTVNPYRKVNAQLYENNTRVASGYIRIQSVTTRNYSLAFFSDNVTWFNEIKNKKIADADLSEWNHVYQKNNILASFDATEGYIYPLIDYGDFISASMLQVAVNKMYPAVFVHTLFKQIFKDIDWKVQGDLIDNPTFNRMIIPFSKEAFNNSRAIIEENTLQDVIASDVTGVQDGDVLMSVTATLDQLNYTVDFTVDVKSLSAGTTLDIDLQINSVTEDFILGITNPDVYSIKFEGINIQDGDVVRLVAKFDPADPPSSNFTLGAGSSLTITPGSVISEEDTVDIAATLPDITQEDFIKYVFNVFGVIPSADPLTRTLTLSLFKDIKNRLSEAVDWSDKLDIGTEREINFEELIENYGRNSNFKYLEDDEDVNLKTYKDVNGQGLGDGVLTIDNEHLEGDVDVYEAPFAPLLNIVSFDGLIYIPNLVKRDVPRIALITAGDRIEVSELTGGNATIFTLTNSTGGAPAGVSTIPFTWFVKASYTKNTNQYFDSLSFGDVSFTIEVEGNLSTYWGEYQEALNRMKYLNAFFRLDSVDIQNLDFTKPIFIDRYNSYFYLNKIVAFTGKDSLTECELIKIA